jgi:hypothetical protein
MRLRMLESVAGVNKMQLRGGRVYMEPYAFDAGVTYELAPDCAHKLLSSGKAVSFEEAPSIYSSIYSSDGTGTLEAQLSTDRR